MLVLNPIDYEKLKKLGFFGRPQVTRVGIVDMQVCVPRGWTDEQAISFAEHMNPSGTTNGWEIRRQGSKWLNGADERVTCSDDDQKVHIMLDA